MSILFIECENCKHYYKNNTGLYTYECYKCLNFNNFAPYHPPYSTYSTSTLDVSGAGATNYTKELDK